MEVFQISIAIGLLIFLGSILALFGISRRRVNLDRRLNQQEESGDSTMSGVAKQVEKVLVNLGERLPRSPAEMSRQERKLVSAGYRRKDAVLLLNGAHVAVAILLLMIMSGTGFLQRYTILSLALTIFLGAAIPDLWLR